MNFALRCYEIILNNISDIFRTHIALKEFARLEGMSKFWNVMSETMGAMSGPG
jgi:hypothetical protein